MKKREQNLIRLKKALMNDKNNTDDSITEFLNLSLANTLSQFFEFDKNNLVTEINYEEKSGYIVKINFLAEKVKEFGKLI